MNRILITGAGSFIGTNYIRYSVNQSVDQVSLLDYQPEDIDFSKYDVVLHLAAIVHQTSKISEDIYFGINRNLAVRVAEQAKKKGIKQFIFLSTSKVYGDYNNRKEPWDEKSQCTPNDSYGKSKFEAEQLLQQLNNEDFTISIVRTPIVYGFGVKANMLSIIKLVDRFSILPFKNVRNQRSFTFVKNLVDYIDRIVERRASGVFIAKDKESISTSELVISISKCLNKKVRLFTLPSLLLRVGLFLFPKIFDRLYGSAILNNELTLHKLDFKPRFTFEEGISDMIKKYQQEKHHNLEP